MLDIIIGEFWQEKQIDFERGGGVVLCIYGTFWNKNRARLSAKEIRIKITLDYRPKKLKKCLIFYARLKEKNPLLVEWRGDSWLSA